MNYEPQRKGPNRLITILLMVIVGTAAFFGGSLFGSLNSDKVISNETPAASDDTFDKLFEVRDILNSQYYQNIDQDVLLEGAIKGMVNAVGDPYTVFFNPEEYKDFNDDGAGNYVGIGEIGRAHV